MRHKLHYIFCIDLPCLILMLLTIGSCRQNEAKRRPVKYFIPDGYTGWIKVSFQVPNAPELPVEDGQYVARIPENGELKTSTQIEYGWAKDQYFYYATQDKRTLKVTGWGGGGMIWGNFNGQEFNGNRQLEQTYLQFFVGPEDEYRKHPNPPRTKDTERVQQ